MIWRELSDFKLYPNFTTILKLKLTKPNLKFQNENKGEGWLIPIDF